MRTKEFLNYHYSPDISHIKSITTPYGKISEHIYNTALTRGFLLEDFDRTDISDEIERIWFENKED